jgi:hypothetical protein
MSLIVPPYHVGIVVENIERSTAELTALLRVDWAQLERREVRQLVHDTIVDTDAAFTFSMQGPPYLELIERRDGTIWEQAGLHHIGLWSDDADAESERFVASGCRMAAVMIDADDRPGSARYHESSDGYLIEIVDIARSGPRMARILGGRLR